MVKLPENGSYMPAPTREMYDGNQSSHNFYTDQTPCRLIELEHFARITAKYMNTMHNDSDNVQIAMNRLRRIYNLEFKLRCEVCGTAHDQDEISAPER